MTWSSPMRNKLRTLGLFLSILALSASANANICNSDWLAAAGGSEVDALVAAGADPNQICTIIRNLPLHQALLTPEIDPRVIEALIRNGARVFIRNSEGDSAFIIAEERFSRVSEGSPQYWREKAIYDAVMRSLESDQFPTAGDAQNQLCDLGWWRSTASESAVNGLLAVPGVDVDHVCINGDRIIQVPLRLTAFRLLPEGVYWGIRALVDAGADLTVENESGESALDMAEVRYGLVTARIIRAQIRWCRGERGAQFVADETTRNQFDTGAYFQIKKSVTKTTREEAVKELRLDLFNTTGSFTKQVVCPYRGINDYR